MMDKTSTPYNPKVSDSGAGPKPASQPPASQTPGISDQIALLRKDLSGLAETVTVLAKDQVGETIGGAQLVAAEKAGELSAAIRSNPMRSAAIAAGVGFVIGLLMTR